MSDEIKPEVENTTPVSDEVVYVKMQPNMYDNWIYVLVPPKFWYAAKLAEGLAEVVRSNQTNVEYTPDTPPAAAEQPTPVEAAPSEPVPAQE